MLDEIEERTLEINFKNYIYIYIYVCVCVCVYSKVGILYAQFLLNFIIVILTDHLKLYKKLQQKRELELHVHRKLWLKLKPCRWFFL